MYTLAPMALIPVVPKSEAHQLGPFLDAQCRLTSKTGHRAEQEGHVDTRPCVAAVACECATGAAEDTNGEGSIRDCVEQDDVRA